MSHFLRTKSLWAPIMLSIGLIFAFTNLIVLSAWLCDDAFITMRCVKQWLSGNGIGFNPNERVMAFTHPTWFLLISAVVGLTGSLYQSVISLSIVFSFSSVATLVWLAFRSRLPLLGLGCVFLLSFSKAFIDYGSSGLENPLSYALFGALFLLLRKNRSDYALIGLTMSLLFLTRMDFALILFPVSLYCLWRGRLECFFAWKWSVLLLGAWFSFAIVYFGSPFPNTFYAKLGSGASLSSLLEKGANYYIVQSIYDPVTLILMVTGVLAGISSRRAVFRCLSLGLIFYGLYIYRIGGDFMMGRFFAVCAFCGVMLIVNRISEMSLHWSMGVVAALSAWVGISTMSTHTHNPWKDSGLEYEVRPFVYGIADSRGSYFARYGYYSQTRKWPELGDFSQDARENKAPLVLCNGLGGYALRTGNARYIIDQCALTDVFLARLPMKTSDDFRIGHLERPLERSYLKSIEKDHNVFVNDALSSLFDDVQTIARDELFTSERFQAIIRLNGGLNSYAPEPATLKKMQDRIESRHLINSQFPGSN